MIFFTDRLYETVAVADYETEEGLRLLDDELNQAIKTGTAIYRATIAKNDKTCENIESGCFVFVPNFRGKIIVLEVMEVEEARNYKKIVAEDAGLELLNSDVKDHNMKGTLKEHIMATIGDDSSWSIGLDEVGDSRNLTLEYTGLSNQTKRIVDIAGRFGCEVSYDFLFDGSRLKAKRINFLKERGEDRAIRLEVGKEIKDVKRNVSITNLRTAVLGVGKPSDETVKTTKVVTTSSKPVTKHTDGKLEPFVNWFKSREGKVSYSMSNRYGPNSYDCSSAVFYAAKHAGLIPENHIIGSTETLFSMKGKYLDEINRSNIRFGDIFVAGREGYSGGAGGHTGVVLDKNKIIHCTYSKNGIATTKIDGFTGGPPVRWFRWKNSGYGEVVVDNSKKKYWTNSDITKHDLGFKLKGLKAGELNNWIKATSPGSPFVGQGQVFMEAEKKSGLDARYILAHAALESAWGKSDIAKKYNNYFGIMAYDSDPDMARNFSNPGLAAGIINGAKWIADNYYNGEYKQRTLYSMRFNNGVHQYATDPNWHTKIADIMKRSERYTSPVSSNVETVEEVKEEKLTGNVSLVGYKYDDGRFFVDKDGRLCDRVANSTWAKPYTNGRYITRIYESEATSQKTLFDECMLQLTKNNTPEISYIVEPDKIPNNIDVGDRVRIIDHDYSPALYLDARLVDITTSSTSPYIEKAVFANFTPRDSGISESLFNMQKNIRDFRYDWDNQPYIMEISSSSGNVFKEDTVNTTLIATVRRTGIDQTPNIDGFIWERVSRYPDKLVVADDVWNDEHKEMNEHFLELSRSDVELEATFVCSAIVNDVAVASASYTIKNFLIGIYKQEEEPERENLQWGDIWQWDDGEGNHFKRIWKGDRWEDTVTKRDLELLELTPGPPGRDGEDGMPGPKGEDGKTSYVHFAYADSADGVVGFTLTATEGKKYIGFYTDFEKADSKEPDSYEWSLFKGEDGSDGIAGKAGEDGKTPYFHMAWADSADGSLNFSTSYAGDKKYMGTYTDFISNDSTDPALYTWVLVRGSDGKDGEDGKSGRLGANLLLNSKRQAESFGGWLISYKLAERIEPDEEVTLSVKMSKALASSVSLQAYFGKGTFLSSLEPDKKVDSLYHATFSWKDAYDDSTELWLYLNSPTGESYILEWAVLGRGDIGAFDWYPANDDLQSQIDNKANNEELQDLIVHFSSYPTAEELRLTSLDVSRQQAYLEQLRNAIDSTALSLEDRIKIIEANVGAGKLTIEAINTYLHFGEEGVLIGKEGEQVRLRLINNALEITDGSKIVARFANNQTETPNLKVSGTFEFGYHVANKLDDGSKKYTIISPNI